MILYWDIDSTLTQPLGAHWNPDVPTDDWVSLHGSNWIMPPDKGRLSVLMELKAAGHEIVIWSCRTNPEVMGLEATEQNAILLTKKVKEWLHHHEIPFDRVEATPKPFFTFLVDDRAINPVIGSNVAMLRYAALKRYASHDEGCPSTKVVEPWQEDDRCTCGLASHLNMDWGINLHGGVRGGRNDT